MIRKINRKKRNEKGFVTVEFVAGLGFLILPTMLLVTVFPTWWERVEMARVASREAARVYVLTHSKQQAMTTVTDIQSNYKMPDRTMNLNLVGDPTVRGGKVTATVTTQIPVTSLPFLNFNKGVMKITEKHTEVVDLYRSRS